MVNIMMRCGAFMACLLAVSVVSADETASQQHPAIAVYHEANCQLLLRYQRFLQSRDKNSKASQAVNEIIAASDCLGSAKSPAATPVLLPTVSSSAFYCHAYLAETGKNTGVHSAVMTLGANTPGVMLESLLAFVERAKRAHPERWQTFDLTEASCNSASGLCINANARSKQTVGQFCFDNRAEAEAQITSFSEDAPAMSLIQ